LWILSYLMCPFLHFVLQMSPDGSYVITASLDKTAKLVDLVSLETLKTYKTGRFVQSAAISPLYDHVLLGGGQDASQVRVVWGDGGC
jgi:translation initiation factor 3 subunit I